MGASYPKIITTKMKYDSPSGWVCIGKYIPPFKPIVNGHGFSGVIVEDLGTGQIQCSVCGEWFKFLGRHIGQHKLSSNEYKYKFGLLKSTALMSKNLRLKHSKDMIKYRKISPKYRHGFQKGNPLANNTKGKHLAEERLNRLGLCDLQVVARIVALSKELGKTPTLADLDERYGRGFTCILKRRYNSYIRICHENGLKPNISNPYLKKYEEMKKKKLKEYTIKE